MDWFSVLLGFVAVGSLCMSVVQGVETYILWTLQKQIPIQTKKAAIELISDPEFMTKAISGTALKTIAQSVAKKVKEIQDGFRGFDSSVKKRFMGEIMKDPAAELIKSKLPKGAQNMLNKYPDLIQTAMEIGGPLIKDRILGHAAPIRGGPHVEEIDGISNVYAYPVER